MGDAADVAQLAERVLGKDEVTSSILVIGSNLRPRAVVADHGQATAVRDGRGGPHRRQRVDNEAERRHG